MIDRDPPPSPGPTRLDGVPARTVSLADGQLWGLARPTPRYRPEVVAGVDPLGRPVETIRAIARIGYPRPIERLVADLRAACRAPAEPGGEHRRYDALMALAVALLRRAHDLGTAQAVALLDLDEAGLARLVDAVLGAVAGVPAAPPDGPDLTHTGGDDGRPS